MLKVMSEIYLIAAFIPTNNIASNPFKFMLSSKIKLKEQVRSLYNVKRWIINVRKMHQSNPNNCKINRLDSFNIASFGNFPLSPIPIAHLSILL